MTSAPISSDPPLAGATAMRPEPVVATVPALGVLAFEGPDAAAFLHGQLSSDVGAMAPLEAAWSSYNSAKGRMLGSLLLWRARPDSLRAFVAADLAEPLRKRLSMFVLRSKVTIADLTPGGRCFGVAGTGARDAVRQALGAAPEPGHGAAVEDGFVVATADGRYLIHAADRIADETGHRLAAHARRVPAEHWDWLGIRAGVPLITLATQDLFVPQTANWDLVGGVNFRKGCYPGQEIIARMQYLGRLKERLLAFHVGAPPPAPATKLFAATFGDQACGTVVNAAPAPAGGSDLLAVVQWAALADPALCLGTPGGPALAPFALPYVVPSPAAPNRPKL